MNHFQTFPPLSPRPHQSPTPLDHRTGHWPTSRCVIEGVLAKGIPALFFPYKYRGPGGEREERKLKEYPRREGESYFLKLKGEGSFKRSSTIEEKAATRASAARRRRTKPSPPATTIFLVDNSTVGSRRRKGNRGEQS